MDWLNQNWIWIAIGVGFFFLMRRGGLGCGMGHAGGHGHHQEERNDGPPTTANRAGALFDPVSRRGVAAAGSAISTVYQGRAYYFETRENRDAFEANPRKYLDETGAKGEPVGAAAEGAQRPHRHHGC